GLVERASGQGIGGHRPPAGLAFGGVPLATRHLADSPLPVGQGSVVAVLWGPVHAALGHDGCEAEQVRFRCGVVGRCQDRPDRRAGHRPTGPAGPASVAHRAVASCADANAWNTRSRAFGRGVKWAAITATVLLTSL